MCPETLPTVKQPVAFRWTTYFSHRGLHIEGFLNRLLRKSLLSSRISHRLTFGDARANGFQWRGAPPPPGSSGKALVSGKAEGKVTQSGVMKGAGSETQPPASEAAGWSAEGVPKKPRWFRVARKPLGTGACCRRGGIRGSASPAFPSRPLEAGPAGTSWPPSRPLPSEVGVVGGEGGGRGPRGVQIFFCETVPSNPTGGWTPCPRPVARWWWAGLRGPRESRFFLLLRDSFRHPPGDHLARPGPPTSSTSPPPPRHSSSSSPSSPSSSRPGHTHRPLINGLLHHGTY